ncbi:hypothetical protein O3P69_007443 [Scylla paramamosain]|uniref:Uncharacterized protein n=1 Tax=Scylla paramamosain TaxID=85552 RepID=A0AAW0V3H0_SCYPA
MELAVFEKRNTEDISTITPTLHLCHKQASGKNTGQSVIVRNGVAALELLGDTLPAPALLERGVEGPVTLSPSEARGGRERAMEKGKMEMPLKWKLNKFLETVTKPSLGKAPQILCINLCRVLPGKVHILEPSFLLLRGFGSIGPECLMVAAHLIRSRKMKPFFRHLSHAVNMRRGAEGSAYGPLDDLHLPHTDDVTRSLVHPIQPVEGNCLSGPCWPGTF